MVALKGLLDLGLAKVYGIDPHNKKRMNDWRNSHQPFHWFSEFPDIVNKRKGGFDVIIGNPPYVVYNEKSFDYKIINFKTESCQDLYSYVIEKSCLITNKKSLLGMIIPISIVSTDGFDKLRNLLYNSISNLWFSCFSMRPAKLFDGVEKHLSIFISNKNGLKSYHTAKYYRWYSERRENLFPILSYNKFNHEICHNESIPKIGKILEASILSKIKSNNFISNFTVEESEYKIIHTRKLRYFVQFLG